MNKFKRGGIVALLFAIFSAMLLLPQLNQHALILGGDSSFHLNRFYDAMMQIKRGQYHYFVSLDGFFQSGRVVNALYGPYLAYFNGFLLFLTGSWFKYQLVSDWVVNMLAACSMYYLLRTNRVRRDYSIWLSLFFVTTYSISTWTLNQQFLAWGTALMPLGIAAATRMFRDSKAPVNVLELTLSVTLMIQTHVLSAVLLVLILAVFFVAAWLGTTNRMQLVKKVLWSALLTLILTSNVWGAMLELYSSNHLLAPFQNMNPLSNGVVNFGTEGSQFSLWLALLAGSQLVLRFSYQQCLSRLNKLVTGVGAILLVASTSLVPWNTIFKWFPSMSILQFPYRLLGPASILLLLGLGLSLTVANKYQQRGQKPDFKLLALGLVTVLSTLTLLGNVQKTAANWGSDHVLASRFNVVQRVTGATLRNKFAAKELGTALTYAYKPTPDYLPAKKAGAATAQSYRLYQQQIAENQYFHKKVQGDNLVVTWNSPVAQPTLVSVVKYGHTQLSLNGKQLTPSDYRLSSIGAVEVKAKQGHNQLILTYRPANFFKVLMVLNWLAWLGLVIVLGCAFLRRCQQAGQTRINMFSSEGAKDRHD